MSPTSTTHQQESLDHTDKRNTPGMWIAAVAGALIIGGCGGFILGHTTSSSAQQNGRGTFGSGFGGRRMNGTIGTVTAVSSSSISVQDQRQNSTVTYAITNDTKITKDGATVAASTIATGDRVLVRATTTNSSSTKTAGTIEVNPTMPSGMGGPAMGQGSDSSASDSSQSN